MLRELLRIPKVLTTTTLSPRVIASSKPLFYRSRFLGTKNTNTPDIDSAESSKTSVSEDQTVENLNPEEFPELFALQDDDEDQEDANDDWFVDPKYEQSSLIDEDKASFVPLWQRKAQDLQTGEKYDMNEEKILAEDGIFTVEKCVNFLKKEKAQNLVVLDMRRKCEWTDYMIVAEAASARHLDSLTGELLRKVKRHRPFDKSIPSHIHVEGRSSEDWTLIDLSKMVVQIFSPESRKRYDLESLWMPFTDPLLTWRDDSEVRTFDRDELIQKVEKDWSPSSKF
ncbi:hypothetical protein K7432_015184 [Basidiobolus ranarum]|uniref:Uncharacterized protein n=1 Tax=Basidiobolus ranarum TaxID=34480 RepID=A0ABR2VNH3_9FUNG